MDKEALRKLCERVREEGLIKNPIISAYVNALMRANNVEKIYFALEKENLLILLRSVAKQYLRGKDIGECNLKLDFLEEVIYEKSLQNEKILKLFIACMKEDTYESCQTFLNVCDLANKYDI